MLKRLELIGFKSFADKTRFDFAPGITAVVGPNGSGKSNVVDAVRWILGEQSAKTLRGGEMADVIFNGSSTRKSLGMAEVTVTFDNAKRLLAVDADEVQVTRRVYRDGTGEYLVNGRDARLKDVKDVFLGSGAGAGGYTIIAQGRVDEVLAASAKDRREIFEEAAGISRFRAKKVETLRKLEHVEANLLRSQDRLDVLRQQLRTLDHQASKARKFQEYSDRLKELRVGLGAREFRELTAALDAESAALAGLRAETAETAARSAALDTEVKRLDWDIGKADESLRHQEGKLADARQQISTHESTLKHERSVLAGVEAELLRVGRQRADLGFRLRALEADAARAADENARTDAALAAERDRAAAAESALAAVAARLADLDRRLEKERAREFDWVRRAATLQSQAKATLDAVGRSQREYEAKRAVIERETARRATLVQALNDLSRAGADVQQRLAAGYARQTDLSARRDTLQAQAEESQRHLEALRVRQSDLRARVDVLEGLERSQDGLGAGVREVLARQSGTTPGLLAGLVADLLTVPREVAPLVELAIGDAAERFVVRDPARVDEVVSALGPLAGRVGFVPFAPPNPPAPFAQREGAAGGWDSDPDAEPSARLLPSPPRGGAGGEVEPASLADFVRCDYPGLERLPHQLLGNVAVVDDLPAARRLAAEFPALRVVTRAGDLLEPDGTLTVGPVLAGAGLVSRKSELRDLRDQLLHLTQQVAGVEVDLAAVRRQVDGMDGVIAGVEDDIDLLADESGGLQQQIAGEREKVANLDDKIETARAEAENLEDEVRHGEEAWTVARVQAQEAEAAAEAVRATLEELRRAAEAGESDRAARQHAHTEAQVALSRAQSIRDRAAERLAGVEAELRKRKVEAVDLAATERAQRARLRDGTLAMLWASAGHADAHREKETRDRAVRELAGRLAADKAERATAADALAELRAGWQEKQNQAHARELAAHDLSARRDALSARIREDYGLDLASLDQGPGAGGEGPDASPAAVPALPLSPGPSPLEASAEIEELKRKLARLGSVNMEALEELARVQAEAGSLQAQHDDLAAAQRSLREIIDRINTDSRKLFTETLAAVRVHFQELFRKLFGGGMADIVLEDAADVLDCGVDITARPPGKELRSISLLSGGEKTLTAIALLLAIFKSKPSPFCLLDEVDAALDEANTQRLAAVLTEFRERSQFIVITHKKRTMAAAEVLHGVTMQESGVSKLVAVRFEDWPENEETTQAA